MNFNFDFIFMNKEILEEFLKICEKLPSPFRLWFGQYLVVFVDKAEDFKIILNSENCIEKSFIYRFFQQDVALFTAPGESMIFYRKFLFVISNYHSTHLETESENAQSHIQFQYFKFIYSNFQR